MSAKINISGFGPETRFEVTPEPAVPFRGAAETELDRLKLRLLREWIVETDDAELNFRLRRAANEACMLAKSSGFPLLMFPALFEEKAAAACAGLIYRAPSEVCATGSAEPALAGA